jgi:hypothetical protein
MVNFKSVLCEPGVLGFSGEGTWYHNAARKLGMDWTDVTFVSETVTAVPWPNINPGLDEILPQWVGRAQQMPAKPFLISFVAMSGSPPLRLDEAQQFTEKVGKKQPWLQGVAGLLVEFGELDADRGKDSLCAEVGKTLDELGELHLPLVARFAATMPVPVLEFTGRHPECNALWIASTGDPRIGLTGRHRLPFTAEKVALARAAGVKTPIIADGVRGRLDAFGLYQAGARGFGIGQTTLARPRRRRQILAMARRLSALDEA